MAKVLLYTTGTCPYCSRALRLLTRKGATYEEIRIDEDPRQREDMIARSGRETVPQIFIDEDHVGGYDDLVELDMAGELEPRLQQ
ncbi:Glutaredoxin, GrxC family [Thioflavicoccus mobilis 8321]|uniref:Glutaredoxin n=1 Tax=Thioflavicoccus mobilis 8321 TaxID=765912 RepID=L0GX81_9GAMM|nr:glutaredoxin 3 [Thioflavicoccus mobilis]AGA90437.1 Glutaredoxin, GrxC family [Thioflavicoccus mobilis 8321]